MIDSIFVCVPGVRLRIVRDGRAVDICAMRGDAPGVSGGDDSRGLRPVLWHQSTRAVHGLVRHDTKHQ